MSEENEKKEEAPEDTKKSGAPVKAIVIALLILIALGVSGFFYYLHARNFVSTDDAYTSGNIHQISARLPASVISVAVEDNQIVKKGDVLVTLDAREFEIDLETANAAVAQAEASKAQAEAAIQLSKANELSSQATVTETEAMGRQADARLSLAKTDYDRNMAVFEKNSGAIAKTDIDSSRERLREAESALEAAAASLEATKAQVVAGEAKTTAAKADQEAAAANLKSAKSKVDLAALNIEFTKITAPVSGKVSKKFVQSGQRLAPGQPLMAIVPQDVWVVANLKETQLAELKIGQSVEIKVDAIPDIVFHGKVESVQEGSGSTFSLLPSDNAIGNFTKIVQRVPVKIVFDEEEAKNYRDRLVPGLSVKPKIDLRSLDK